MSAFQEVIELAWDDKKQPGKLLVSASKEHAALIAERDALRGQVETLRGVVVLYVMLVGNTGYSIGRESASEAYALAQAALAATAPDASEAGQ